MDKKFVRVLLFIVISLLFGAAFYACKENLILETLFDDSYDKVFIIGLILLVPDFLLYLVCDSEKYTSKRLVAFKRFMYLILMIVEVGLSLPILYTAISTLEYKEPTSVILNGVYGMVGLSPLLRAVMYGNNIYNESSDGGKPFIGLWSYLLGYILGLLISFAGRYVSLIHAYGLLIMLGLELLVLLISLIKTGFIFKVEEVRVSGPQFSYSKTQTVFPVAKGSPNKNHSYQLEARLQKEIDEFLRRQPREYTWTGYSKVEIKLSSNVNLYNYSVVVTYDVILYHNKKQAPKDSEVRYYEGVEKHSQREFVNSYSREIERINEQVLRICYRFEQDHPDQKGHWSVDSKTNVYTQVE